MKSKFYLGLFGYFFTIIIFAAALINPGEYQYLYNNGGFLYFLWEFFLIVIYLMLSNKPAKFFSKLYDYFWILIILGIFLAIGITEGYRAFSILIVVNFFSNLLINRHIPDAKILTVRFILLWVSVMILLPILSFLIETLWLVRNFFNSETIKISTSTGGGALQDPTNVLIWGIGYYSMLLLFDLFLHFKKRLDQFK